MNHDMSFQEQDIRPQGLRLENAALRAVDQQDLLERRKSFVAVCCPACGADAEEELFHKDDFRFARCTACRSVYVNPRPTQDMLQRFYAHAKSVRHWQQKLFPASEHGRLHGIVKPRVERLAELCSNGSAQRRTLLDAGAGFGTFCQEVRRRALFERVVALDASPHMAAACRSRNLEVCEAPVEQCPLEGVDVITAFELIEHLFDPGVFLQRCRQALRPNGLLVLTTPNIQGFDVEILGPASRTFAAPEHLNYFHPASLVVLLKRAGFEVIECCTPGRLDAEMVRKEVLCGNLNLAGRPFLRRVLVDEWDRLGSDFQQFLAGHGLSSHLWAVGRAAGEG